MAKNGYPDVRTKALLALLRLNTDIALDAIEQFVKAGTPEDKKIYLAVTPHMDADTNLPFLKTLIGDGDERVRQMAIRTVGNFVERRSYLELFRKVLQSGDIPNEVLKIIGQKKLCAFKQVLLEIFLDPLHALWTRYHALVALGAFSDHSLFPIFIKAVKDKDNLIKIGGLKALAELNDRKAIPHIRPYTKNADEDVRTAAQMAIERLSRAQDI
jgi:HEAT repeat protein